MNKWFFCSSPFPLIFSTIYMTDLPFLHLKMNLSEDRFFVFPPLFQYVNNVESVLSDISYSVLCKDEFEVQCSLSVALPKGNI